MVWLHGYRWSETVVKKREELRIGAKRRVDLVERCHEIAID